MSNRFKKRVVVDDEGKPVSVLLDIKTYYRLMSELEELESVRAYDAAKASDSEQIPFEQATQEIEKSRQCSTKS